MARVRKYIRGQRLTFDQVINRLASNEYIMFYDTPTHPAWAASWSIRTVFALCQAGRLFDAIRNPQHKDNAR